MKIRALRGAAGQQYAIIVGMIGVIAVLAVTAAGKQISVIFDKSSNSVADAINSQILPDGFTIPPLNGAEPSSVVTSQTVTVSGFTGSPNVTVSGGGNPSLSVNGGGFAPSSNIRAGDSLNVRLTAPAGFSASITATVNLGQLSVPFVVTTRAIDTTPDSFAFTNVTGQNTSTLVTSDTVTLAGFDGPQTVSISGAGTPEFSIAGGSFTSTPSPINPGQTLQLRMTTSASFSGNVSATVTVGGASVTWTADNRAIDITPDAFTFNNLTGQSTNALVTSNAVTVTGFDGPLNATVSGGGSPQISVAGGAFSAGPTPINAGQTIAVRLTTPAGAGQTNTATVTISGVSGSFAASTVSGPYTFTVCGQSGNSGPSQAQCNSAYGSGVVTVSSGYQQWTVPTTGTWRIEAWGAQAGYATGYSGSTGLGAYAKGEISLTSGTVLTMLVGQQGGSNNYSGGGGGGTFVTQGSNYTTSTLLIAAGGGGAYGASGSGGAFNNGIASNAGQSGNSGGGTGGNGGGSSGSSGWGGAGSGFTGNGGSGGSYGGQSYAFRNGGTGGPASNACNYAATGGFGGGGGNGCWGGGGGGGYSGGGSGGGGGGSYISGANSSWTTGTRSGDGQVKLTYVGP